MSQNAIEIGIPECLALDKQCPDIMNFLTVPKNFLFEKSVPLSIKRPISSLEHFIFTNSSIFSPLYFFEKI